MCLFVVGDLGFGMKELAQGLLEEIPSERRWKVSRVGKAVDGGEE